MEKLKTMKEIAKDAVYEAMKNITLNEMTLEDFADRVNNAYRIRKCHVVTCRYNKDCICQNEDEQKECVDVSMKVLCLGNFDENNSVSY